MKNNEFDSSSIFLFLIRWWVHLAIICLVAAAAAAIFSGPRFITPKFQSTVTMFPATSGSLSRSVLAGPAGGRQDFLDFGDVEEAERLLQVLESGNIRDRVVQRFDLMGHYDISEQSPYRNTLLSEEYRGNISFRRTQFGAVEISVRDKEPAMAAKIANELAALADTIQNELRMERAQLAHDVLEQQYENLLDQARRSEDTLKSIMHRGVFDLEGQSSMLTRQLAMDLSAGRQEGVEALERRLSTLGDYGGALLYHSAYLANVSEHLIMVQRRYQEAKTDLNNFVPYKLVLDSAFEAERKVYPVRWLIVFLSTFAAGLMAIMTLMVYENLVTKGLWNEAIRSKSSNVNKSGV